MPRRTALVPFQQGDLDGLCGIYALINAIRLTTEADTRCFPDAAWQELFCTLLLEPDEVVGTVDTVGLGIDTTPPIGWRKRLFGTWSMSTASG